MLMPHQQRRLTALTALLIVSLMALIPRLIWLVTLSQGEIKAKTIQRVRVSWTEGTVIPGRRGKIFDRNMVELARDETSFEVLARPERLLQSYEYAARLLAPLLGKSESKLREQLRPVVKEGKHRKMYVPLSRREAPEFQVAYKANLQALLEDLQANPPPGRKIADIEKELNLGIELVERPDRYYPRGSKMAHVLGFAGPRPEKEGDQDENRDEWLLGLVGKMGCEKSLDGFLRGCSGRRETRNVGGGVTTEWLRTIPARSGHHVVLTLDLGLQSFVEEAMEETWKEFNPEGMSVIVLQPKTGRVLAMANRPTFDPNNLTAEPDLWRNRAISECADPGSTFKPITYGAALNERLVNLDTLIDCRSDNYRRRYYRKVRPQPVTDDHREEVIPVWKAFAKSSNIGAVELGVEFLGRNRLLRYVERFGIAQRTGIALPGEAQGAISHERSAYLANAYGYSVTVTPLQMAMAHAVIANEGRLMRPMVVERIVNPDGGVLVDFQPVEVRQVISASAARDVGKAMRMAVTDGTCKVAQLEDYFVAAKTGTAQRSPRYLPGEYLSSFSGYFPVEDPQVLILVVVDKPKGKYYGAGVSGPLWLKIAEMAGPYLGIAPSVREDSSDRYQPIDPGYPPVKVQYQNVASH